MCGVGIVHALKGACCVVWCLCAECGLSVFGVCMGHGVESDV